MIKSIDARRYRRVCRYLRYISNTSLLSIGQYGPALKICRVDCFRNFNTIYTRRNVREYAGVLIHEATHGLLFEKGIAYNKKTRERVESLCHLEAYRFALHFEPGYADLFPGPYNPKGHRRFWKSSFRVRFVELWKRLNQDYKPVNPKSAEDYSRRGASYLQKRDYDKAIADCDEAIRLDPKLAKAYSNRGTAHVKKRDYDKAIADFDRAIQINPQDAKTYLNRSAAHLQKHDYDQVIADCDEAIRFDAKFAAAYSNRGAAYLRKSNFDHAIADLDYAIQLKDKDARIYLNRGVAYSRKRDYGKAIVDYDQAIQLKPGDATAYKNLAWLLATCQEASFRDGKRAVEQATKACAISAWNDPIAVKILAAACAEAGDFENAVKWESEYLGTPRLSPQARADAQKRFALYLSHKPYHAD